MMHALVVLFIVHSHVISWLFVFLELILLIFEVIRFRLRWHHSRNVLALLLLTLLLVWNCTLGYASDWFTLVVVNIIALMLTGLLMMLPFLYPKRKPDDVQEETSLQDGKSMPDPLLANCIAYQLSAREIDVVLLIRKGYRNKQIAEELFISEKTVESHLQNIYDKVGERSRLAVIGKLNRW